MVKQNLIMFLVIFNLILLFMLAVDYTFVNLILMLVLIILDILVFKSY